MPPRAKSVFTPLRSPRVCFFESFVTVHSQLTSIFSRQPHLVLLRPTPSLQGWHVWRHQRPSIWREDFRCLRCEFALTNQSNRFAFSQRSPLTGQRSIDRGARSRCNRALHPTYPGSRFHHPRCRRHPDWRHLLRRRCPVHRRCHSFAECSRYRCCRYRQPPIGCRHGPRRSRWKLPSLSLIMDLDGRGDSVGRGRPSLDGVHSWVNHLFWIFVDTFRTAVL